MYEQHIQPIPTAEDDESLTMLRPLKLMYLAAVKRKDRLEQEVLSKRGCALLEQADSLITELNDSFRATGSAPVGDVVRLVEFAGAMESYTKTDDASHLDAAQVKLASGAKERLVAA